jgi:hypothetical protein
MTQRRFIPPWDIEDNGACFIIRDRNGQALSYVYYENEPGRRSAASLLTREGGGPPYCDQYCKLPELLKGRSIKGRRRWRGISSRGRRA